MKKVEPPKILVDLYRDLRDRRLLLPFGLLAVALVLVPVALSKSSHPSASPAVGVAGSRPVSAAEPAVMTEDVGVRSYNKRLAALKEKDPFKRNFKLPKLPGGNPGRLAPPASAGVAATPPSSPAAASSAVSATPPATTASSSSSSADTPPTSTTRTVTVQSHVPQPRVYNTVVDLKIGAPGDLKRRDGVKPLTQLPHASNPVVALMGATLDRTTATFLVSRDVASVQGGSGCSPNRSACQLLTMKPGGRAKLVDPTSGKTYVLKVLDIRLVRVKLSGKTGSGKSQAGGTHGRRSTAFAQSLGG